MPSPSLRPTRVRVLVGLVFLLVLAACTTGCVRRRMTIRSNPPGAMVYVDDYPIGVTPVSTNFTYYGTRKIRLVKDGYQTLTVMQPIDAPWYQYPPIDFVTENLVPGEIRDSRSLVFNLAPQMVVPTETLLGRAEQLRSGMDPALATGSAPPAVVTPGPPTTSPGDFAPWDPPPSGPMTPSEPLPVPPGVGGQPTYPLPPGGP